MRTIETRRDRMAMVHDAGLGKISLVSVLAGVLVAYGAFAVVAAITAAVLDAVGVDTADFTANDWRELGVGGGIVAAAVLLLSYLFGGYVAGRMARRAGAANGLAVFVLSVLVAVAVGAAISTQTDTDTIVDNLRSLGVPTSGGEYSALGTVAGIGSLLAMLVGSLFGGMAGERWHGKLVTRALDPTVGPEAVAADQAAEAAKRRAALEERRHDREIDLRRGTRPVTDRDDDDPSYRPRRDERVEADDVDAPRDSDGRLTGSFRRPRD